MKRISNPRFPHTCRIYTVSGETSFADGEETILYEGICRKETNTALRTFKTDSVIKADYSISVPGTIEGIRSGCFVDYTDTGGSAERLLVSDCFAGNLGTTVYFNEPKN